MRRISLTRRFEQMQVKTCIASQLRTFHPEIRKTLIENISDLVVALVQARHVHFAKIAEKLNRGGTAESREQWVRRQLDNRTMSTAQLFRPMVQCLLQGLIGRSVYLILDRTDLDDERCTVMLMLAYRGRALPLVWMSFEMKPGMIGDSVTLLFRELRQWLPEGVKVYLLADREFHGVDILELIVAQGWIPVVRGKGTTTATLADGTQRPLNAWTPPVGQMTFHNAVWLTAEQVGPFSLSTSCAPTEARQGLGSVVHHQYRTRWSTSNPHVRETLLD